MKLRAVKWNLRWRALQRSRHPLYDHQRARFNECGQERRLVRPGEEQTAPRILPNPAPVNALYGRETAHAVTFRNLLQRQSYQDLDEIRGEGRQEGQQQALRDAILGVILARGLVADDAARSLLAATDDPCALRRHLIRAATAEEVFADE